MGSKTEMIPANIAFISSIYLILEELKKCLTNQMYFDILNRCHK